MVVADTSALISLATCDVLEVVLEEFEVQTTALVIEELEATAAYDDVHGRAATDVLERRDRLTVHDIRASQYDSSNVDEGESSCVELSRTLEASFLLTDDLRALPELQVHTDARVASSPIVLRALVKRGRITNAEARERLEEIADTIGWLGAPIYRRARLLFDEE